MFSDQSAKIKAAAPIKKSACRGGVCVWDSAYGWGGKWEVGKFGRLLEVVGGEVVSRDGEGYVSM